MDSDRAFNGGTLGFDIPQAERTPLVNQLLRIIQGLQDENGRLREEIDRLKGLPPTPTRSPRQPSMLGGDQPPSKPSKPQTSPDGKRPGSAKRHKTAQLHIHQTIPLTPPNLPPDAQKVSQRDFIVQDLHIENCNTCYRREVYRLPDGSHVVGEVPANVRGHFGPTLRAYILYQHYQNHVTQPLIRQELLDHGVVISVGQIDRMLHEGHDAFHAEKELLLPGAREVSSHFHADDTGARHRGQNYHTTGIGNEWFSVFTTTATKSRINFLEILRAPYDEYVLDDDALVYLAHYDLAQCWQEQLREVVEQGAGRILIAGAAAWDQQLDRWGVHSAEPRRLITEAALWGCLMYHDLYVGQPIISDDAKQFKLLGYAHALCWLHAERNVARVVPLTAAQHDALERVRDEIWNYYQRLKAYRDAPTPQKKGRLERDFDRLFLQRTGFVELNEALERVHRKKAELLLVLEYPHLPLQNNLAERDLRDWAKTRKISAGTRSDLGRRCRDTFMSLKKTCRKLGISFWTYLQDRIHGWGRILPLSQLIQRRAEQPT
jgi:hypothetical protein